MRLLKTTNVGVRMAWVRGYFKYSHPVKCTYTCMYLLFLDCPSLKSWLCFAQVLNVDLTHTELGAHPRGAH